MKLLEDIVKDVREGLITITPYAILSIYRSSEFINGINYKKQIEEFNKTKTDSGSLVTLSTMKLPYTIYGENNIGLIQNIRVTFEPTYGGSFMATIDDLSAGRQMLKFLNLARKPNKDDTTNRIATTWATVQLGWLTSNNEKIESPQVLFQINKINSRYSGGRFSYTISGQPMVVPLGFGAPMPEAGNYSGKIINAIDEWEKQNFPIKITNKDLIDPSIDIPKTNKTISPANAAPFDMLKRILKYAEPVDRTGGRLSYRLMPATYTNPEQHVVIEQFSPKLTDLFKTYQIGHPYSLVESLELEDDLSTSYITDSYVVNTCDIDNMNFTEYGNKDDIINEDTAVRNTTSNITGDAKPNVAAEAMLGIADVTRGTMVTIGDPLLVPNINMDNSSDSTTEFFNASNPFLGVRILTHTTPANNYIAKGDSSNPDFQDSYIDGIYSVVEVVHDISTESYKTTLTVERNPSYTTVLVKSGIKSK